MDADSFLSSLCFQVPRPRSSRSKAQPPAAPCERPVPATAARGSPACGAGGIRARGFGRRPLRRTRRRAAPGFFWGRNGEGAPGTHPSLLARRGPANAALRLLEPQTKYPLSYGNVIYVCSARKTPAMRQGRAGFRSSCRLPAASSPPKMQPQPHSTPPLAPSPPPPTPAPAWYRGTCRHQVLRERESRQRPGQDQDLGLEWASEPKSLGVGG